MHEVDHERMAKVRSSLLRPGALPARADLETGLAQLTPAAAAEAGG